MNPHPRHSPMIVSRNWDKMPLLRKHGFVQVTDSPLPPIELPYPVKVCVPQYFEGSVPFYLYITNQDQSVQFVVSDESLVDELLAAMTDHPSEPDGLGASSMYCWAETLAGGMVNFDTETVCPREQW